MPAPVRPLISHDEFVATRLGSRPGGSPVRLPVHRYSIDAYITHAPEKPKLPVTFSSELRELIEELDNKPGCELVLASSVPRFNVTPTGIFALDLTLGGGWADGFPSMVYGHGNSGKTTTMLKAIANIQRKFPRHKCVLCDVETTFDPAWAEALGVDCTRLLILRPSSAEEGADILLGLTQLPEIAGMFLDSIPVFVPNKDFDDSLSDAVMATRARLMSRFSSNLLQATMIEGQKRCDLNPFGHKFSWFSVNSWRNKIGLVFGDPRTLPGGDWQHTFHRTKIEMKSKESMDALNGAAPAVNEETGKAKKKKGNEVSHTEHEFIVAKAKIPGTRSGEFQMIMDPAHPLGLGAIDDGATVGAWAKRLGIVRQSGKNLVSDVFDYTLSGREDLEHRMVTDPEFANWLRLACLVKQRVYLNMAPLPPDGYLVDTSVAPGRAKALRPVIAPVRKPGTGVGLTRSPLLLRA